jgi:modulator of FtsH protease
VNIAYVSTAYVSTAYDAASWTDFGVSVTGAAAALAGLLFIAISINLRQILDSDGLPSRAAQTLILFGTPLVTAVLVVVPGQARLALGLELIGLGVVVGAGQLYLDLASAHTEEDTMWRRLAGRVFPALLNCGCLAVAGATYIAQAGGGLYWLVPSVLVALVFGLLNVWVLLVEILR